ncbi:MAG: thymidine phosphorylase, partial [Candidatus Hodarchaeales archaeon]
SHPRKPYEKDELDNIVHANTTGELTPLETSMFITAQVFQEWSLNEIKYLTQAIANSGQTVKWDDIVIYDKHSLGGVPGNKVSLLIVPIIAAAGLTIPKTSSRAITSPSGTTDTIEAMGCDVEFSIDEIVEISKRVGGLIAWTGGLNIVPADEKIIRTVQFPLGFDPEPMMMASIISKKLAMGVKTLALDIPCGPGTKVANIEEGKRIAHRFSELGRQLDIRIESGITYGNQPIGHAIGPALEAREALSSLKTPKSAPESLIGKSTALAGILLEMSGKSPQGRGQDYAMSLLHSGRAYEKFKDILEAQNADPNMIPEDIEIGSAIYEYLAPQNGWVIEINNKVIVRAARAAGAPMDKRAGIVFLKKMDSVTRGEVLFRIYASNDKKLDAAITELTKAPPIVIEGMLLARG